VGVRVDVDGEPLAPGAAVSGRIVVEEGGSARSLSVGLAFVERTESFEKVARDAATLVVAEGDLADGVALAFSLPLPDDALPNIATRTGASAGRSAPASTARALTQPSTGRSSCCRVTLPRIDRERWPSG
jgi:hypothetical protein